MMITFSLGRNRDINNNINTFLDPHDRLGVYVGGGRFVLLLPLSTCFLPRFPTYEGRERGRSNKRQYLFFLLFSAVIGNGGNGWWRKGLIFSGIWGGTVC